ncbi:MAG: DUF885 domain-containing protein, partial [Planctomycetota bacterium]
SNGGILRKILNPVTVSLTLGLLSSAHAQSNADEAFERIADDFINDLPVLSPVDATSIGDHRQDGALDNVDSEARTGNVDIVQKYLARLHEIDIQSLSRANQVDADMLLNELESRLWQIETYQEWAWNPLVYVRLSGNAIYALMARDFAPLSERLENAAARLEQMPRFFAQARASLQSQRVPKIHAETAIRQNAGLNTIIEAMIAPHEGSVSGESKFRLQAAMATARNAVNEHQAWLENELLPRAAGDFRIGADLFDTKLRFTLNSPLGRKEIRTRAENEYVAVRDQMYQISKALYADRFPSTSFPDIADEAYKQVIIRAALEQAYQRMPDPEEIVPLAREYLRQATDFVRERNLVTVPGEPLEIIVMPEFRRGVTLAYLDPAGPLDRGQKSFYAVAPLPENWTEDQVDSFLREYNLLSIQSLTIHEAMPGHYLQLALSNRYPSALRAVLSSGPFIEGWAVYAERMMGDAGYLEDDRLMRLIVLKWYLRAVTNAIIDQAIHIDGMSREAAMKLMVEGGFQEEREAAGKWVRSQLTATQLSTYFVGFQEHLDMRVAVEQAWGEEFTLKRYHDQVLSYGSPSVKHVRALILNEEIPHRKP